MLLQGTKLRGILLSGRGRVIKASKPVYKGLFLVRQSPLRKDDHDQ